MTEYRDSGIAAAGRLAWGTHFALFFEEPGRLAETVCDYFSAGFKGGEHGLWLVSEPFSRSQAQALAKQWALDASMECIDFEDWYLHDGEFDRRRAVDRWNTKVLQVRARGGTGLRVFASEPWLKRDYGCRFLDYERSLCSHLAELQLLMLCAYPLDTALPADMLRVSRAHHLVLVSQGGCLQAVQTRDSDGEFEERVKTRTRQLQEANQELRRLAARLQSVREQEGTRIARELHDELGSSLAGLRWEIEELDRGIEGNGAPRARVAGMTKLVDDIINSVRRISSELRPAILDDLGVTAAIEWHCEQFEARTGIECRCDIQVHQLEFSSDEATAVYRIFQEALTNILRHAQATHVDIRLLAEGEDFFMEIADNGVGIPEAARSDPRSLGLIGMRERAQLLGGHLDIDGEHRGGSVLTLRFPLESAK